jgi:hypothetical protein
MEQNMNVTGIRYNPPVSIGFSVTDDIEKKKNQVTKVINEPDVINEVKSTSAWKKDILMQAIEKLENNKQLDDSHPLDRFESAPIETYGEAIIELHLTKSNDFAKYASQAQANIMPQDIMNLFVGEPF